MADGLRQKIVTALLAQLGTIRVANGYETDLGLFVSEWRDLDAQPWTQTEAGLSALNFKDKREPAIAEPGKTCLTKQDKTLECHLELATNVVPTNGSVAQQVRKMIADVEKCLANAGTWLTTVKITSVSPITVNDMDVAQAGKVFGGAKLEFSIGYTTPRHNPYTQ